MTGSGPRPAPRRLQRLLDAVELAQPLGDLERALLQWAEPSGWALQTVDEFEALARAVELQPTPWSEDMALDVRMGADAREGLRRRPPAGFLGYVQIWQSRLATQRALGVGDEGRLRALQQTLGGILIDGKSAAFLLLVPQADGTWVNLGFETVTWIDRCPLGPERHQARILRLHELPANDRRYVRTQ